MKTEYQIRNALNLIRFACRASDDADFFSTFGVCLEWVLNESPNDQFDEGLKRLKIARNLANNTNISEN